jgi:hypothetical protein
MTPLEELEKQKSHHNSLKGKDPQFRVEYRFPQGTKHWKYFMTLDDAKQSNYFAVTYPLIGLRPYKVYPLSKQIQKKGPRGGWSKLKE